MCPQKGLFLVYFEISHREFIDAMNSIKSEFQKMQQGKFDEVDFNKMKTFFGAIAKNIDVQKKRIGGNFSVAHAVNR